MSSSDRVVAGRYRLRRRLGQGAMGTVWEAFDEYLRRPVAVKEVLLPPGLPEEHAAELRERTLREARAIAVLSHPNVVTLHDVAREGGEPFVVMEYMLAHSLAQLIEVLGPQPESRAALIADAVAAGLAAAHQAGITHRDVKPGNVLIGVDGRVKLTDFGIARNVAERTLTSTGIMLGSPAYIAPEVAAGREVTPSADLWGLGATLFAVIEGQPPYDVSGAVLATVNQVVNGEVPRPSVKGPLSDIVAALMVKEPEKRITLRELRNRLHPLLPPPSTPLLPDEDLTRLNEAATRRPDHAPTTPENPAAQHGDGAHDGPHAAAGHPSEGSSPAKKQSSQPPHTAPGDQPPSSRAPLSNEHGAPSEAPRAPLSHESDAPLGPPSGLGSSPGSPSSAELGSIPLAADPGALPWESRASLTNEPGAPSGSPRASLSDEPGALPGVSRAPLSDESGAPKGSGSGSGTRSGSGVGSESSSGAEAASSAAEVGELPSSLRAALSGGSGALAGARGADSSLASAPGPLPFEATARAQVGSERRPAGRGSIATGVVAFLAVLLFFAAAGGGFALSRYVGGKSLLPPEDTALTATSTPSKDDHLDMVSTRTGNAGGTDKQGGGFSVPVPRDWVEFVEQIEDDEFVNSTRVYYASPDGTQLLTVERFPNLYPDYTIADYLEKLQSTEPDVTVTVVYKREINGLENATVPPAEPAWELNYRATANTKVLAPDDEVALDQTRTTFARLLPYAGDLWVVSVTVPIDQEDSGNALFERTVPSFQVTG